MSYTVSQAALRVLRGRKRYVGLAIVLAGLFAWWWWSVPPEVQAYRHGAPRRWAKFESERALQGGARPAYTYVPLQAVSVDLQLAVLSGEDIGFLFHAGFDVAAMQEALTEWWEGDELRGASTITQQLAKNLFLSADRSLWRKVREARYAYWLEEVLPKRRILEVYLNIVELGDGVFGVEAAAQRYFGVGAAYLTAEQAASLAAAIPSPVKHNPATQTRAFLARERAIRARMQRYENVRARLAELL